MTAAVGAPSPADVAGWSRGSPLLAAEGFTHAFCHHGRPDADVVTCAAVAPGRALHQARQVHGAAVAIAAHWRSGDPPEADAIISADPACACAVRTADCAPALLACRATGAVAAVHAGWRGISRGVIAAAVRRLAHEFGASPDAMVAAVGPCARARRYEVGEDVVSAMLAAGCASAVVRHPDLPRPFLDVARAAAIQLAACGIREACIDADPPCSIESLWCPSHRRDPSSGARMLSIIVPRLTRNHG